MLSNAWRFTVQAADVEIIADFEAGTYEARLDTDTSVKDDDASRLAQSHHPEAWKIDRSFVVPRQAIWPTLRQWLQIFRSLGIAHALMRRPPRDWVSWLRRKDNGTDESEARIRQLVAVFHTAATLLPGLSRCLPRSMALLDFLACNGVRCGWVFAVRPVPFEAHCWVQWRDIVLTDHVDHVRWFTVFLVVD